jgi:hypothetical protein
LFIHNAIAPSYRILYLATFHYLQLQQAILHPFFQWCESSLVVATLKCSFMLSPGINLSATPNITAYTHAPAAYIMPFGRRTLHDMAHLAMAPNQYALSHVYLIVWMNGLYLKTNTIVASEGDPIRNIHGSRSISCGNIANPRRTLDSATGKIISSFR